MKKRTMSMLLALAMIFALCVPALAAGDSPVRLTQVDIYSDGMLYQHYELSYYEGTQLREQRVSTYWPARRCPRRSRPAPMTATGT